MGKLKLSDMTKDIIACGTKNRKLKANFLLKNFLIEGFKVPLLFVCFELALCHYRGLAFKNLQIFVALKFYLNTQGKTVHISISHDAYM